MTKSLVAAKPIIPERLEEFLSDPPLIGTERLEDYKAFLLVIVRAAKPVDDICWLLVRDLVDIWWEIRRERFIKIAIIKKKQQYVASTMGNTRADYIREAQRAEKMLSTPLDEDDEPSAFRKKGSQPIDRNPEDPMSLLAEAYLHDGDEIEGCDRRIAALEFRRGALLREVERRNQNMARGADKAASDIVDAEFTEPED
jgi:hypothetical protein